jgi:hypothetical protein
MGLLVQNQNQMAERLAKGVEEMKSLHRKAQRATEENKTIDGTRNQGEYNRWSAALKIQAESPRALKAFLVAARRLIEDFARSKNFDEAHGSFLVEV